MASPIRTAILALVAASGTASAQECSWFVADVPDFDQRRLNALPSNGGMYCVPTSFTDWFAYLANRGVPQPLTLDGPRDWESNTNYNRVTDTLTFMGGLMSTDPSGGTDLNNALEGAKLYSLLNLNSDLVFCGEYVWGGGEAPTPEKLLAFHKLGAYTCASYGFYSGTTGGTRGGGHCIALTGVWDLSCGSNPILQFSDAADDSANTTQSEFRTSLAAMTPITGNFRPTASSSFSQVTLYRLDVTNASMNFLDKLFVILPMSAIFGGGSGDANEIQLVRPFRPQGNPSPANVFFNKPAGTGAVVDVVMSSDPLTHYYTTDQGTTQSPGAYRLNVLTGQSTRISAPSATGFSPTRLAYGRLGDLYLINGDAVARYDPRTTPMTLLGAFSPTFTPDAIAYDDKNDTVIILSVPPGIGARRVTTRPRSLSGIGTDRALPATYNGEAFIQPDADTAGALFVCSEGSGVLRRFEVQGGDLVETDSIIHISGSLTALNVTDANRLVYANNGILIEREENAAGTWVNRANSRWAGRAATGAVSLARSRSNYIASIMQDPAFNNLANPTVYPTLPACYANCDHSTLAPVLNVNDFTCFMNRYASGHVYANCDNSTVAPLLNVNDFTCYLNRYAAGCS